MEAWLEAYHYTKSSFAINFGQLDARAGAIQVLLTQKALLTYSEIT